jgi:hypothetical protein
MTTTRWGVRTKLSLKDFLMKPNNGWFEICEKNSSLDVYSKNLYSFECEILIVCFNAAVPSREKKTPPFFSGLNISDDLGVPVISISDPSLYHSDKVSLGWYAGNSIQPDFQLTVRHFLDSLCDVVKRKVVVIGGSGGGFAGLAQNVFASPARFSSLVWNPQVSITDYYESFVTRYIKFCWGTFVDDYPSDVIKFLESQNVVHDLRFKEFKSEGHIIYLQNYSDSSHYSKHCMSFVNAQAMKRIDDQFYRYVYENGRLQVKIGEWGQGHVSPPLEILKHEINML